MSGDCFTKYIRKYLDVGGAAAHKQVGQQQR